MKIRQINATIHYCESNRKEQQNVTLLFDDNAEKYELTKVYVVEFQTKLVFSKTDNTLLVNG